MRYLVPLILIDHFFNFMVSFTQIEVGRQNTVRDLKVILAEQKGVNVSMLDLLCGGRALVDVELLSAIEAPFVVVHNRKPPRKDAKVQKEQLNRSDECGICLSRKANTRLRPCGHELCRLCARKVTQCPFCRENIYDNRPTSEKTDKRKCTLCKEALPLTAFPCRCGNLYCLAHRPPEEHECTFDYQSAQAAQLRGYRPHEHVGGPGTFEKIWEVVSPAAFWDWYHGFYWDHFTTSGHNRRVGALLFCLLTLLFSQARLWITLLCIPPLWALLVVCSLPPEGSRGAELRPFSSPLIAAFVVMADICMTHERVKVWLRRRGWLAPLVSST